MRRRSPASSGVVAHQPHDRQRGEVQDQPPRGSPRSSSQLVPLHGPERGAVSMADVNLRRYIQPGRYLVGFYKDQLLPRFQDKVMDRRATHDVRARVCAGLRGDVVEVGFGTGLNVAHYPPEVTKVLAIEPSTVCMRIAEPASPGRRPR